jgi:hypothetical protein
MSLYMSALSFELSVSLYLIIHFTSTDTHIPSM